MNGVKWVYQGDEEEVKLWIFRKYKVLDALYEAIALYKEKHKKYPLQKSQEFISKVVSFWISVAPILKLEREQAMKVWEIKSLFEKFRECEKLYFALGDKLKSEGILLLKRKPHLGTKSKAEGMIYGFR